jgi:hypothetical protein
LQPKPEKVYDKNVMLLYILCGSLLESVQEGKGEIIYQFRQCSVVGVSLRESVTMYFFKVFEFQVGMSARFDPHTLGLGGESVAQGCKNLPPVAI